MFTFDTGSNGASGPFLAWSARGTQDGAVGPRKFFIRDGGTKTEYDASKGFVLDIEGMKTGFQRSEGVAGVAPEWKWNASVTQMMASPGDDWKKGFSIRCAIGGGSTSHMGAGRRCTLGLPDRPGTQAVRAAGQGHAAAGQAGGRTRGAVQARLDRRADLADRQMG
jgi:hypothetical protein